MAHSPGTRKRTNEGRGLTSMGALSFVHVCNEI
jgi:hypothetical protein